LSKHSAIPALAIWAVALTAGTALGGEIKIGGFGQVQIADGSAPGNHLACDVKRLRLTVKSDVTEKIGYYAQFDMLSATSNLLDFLIDYDLGAAGRLGVGRFRRPFGLQHTFSTFDLNTINYSQAVSKILVSGSRDFGLRLMGKRGPANWVLGLVNGAYPAQFVTLIGDDDDVKDMVGRAGLRILRSLEIGASGYFARSSSSGPQEIKAGADLRYEKCGILIQTEAIYAKDGSRLERAGGYLEAGYRIRRIQPIIRYDLYDADTRGPTTNEKTILAAGANYFFNEKAVVRFIFEEHVDRLDQDRSDRDDDNVCILQLGARI
jgi:hypothetical protein